MGSILEQVCNLLAVLLWVSTAVHAAQNSLIQPCRRLVFALFFSCQLAILLNETLRTSKKSCSGFCFCLVCVMRRTSFASNKSVHNTHSLHRLGYSVMQGCPSASDRSVFKQSIDSTSTKFLCKAFLQQPTDTDTVLNQHVDSSSKCQLYHTPMQRTSFMQVTDTGSGYGCQLLIRVETAAGHTILPAGALKDLLLIGVFAD